MLRQSLREDDAGKWSAFEVGLVVARQNGKGTVIEARELAGLFLFGEQLILHSAHEFKTAGDAFRRVLSLIQGSDDLSSRVLRVHRAAGNEGIELRNGSRLRFVARTGGSGRGFSADLAVLDEAYNLPEHAMAAILPTLSARPNPQVWYTSSAVNAELHPHGLVLARVRRRGLAGNDPSLCYLEWSVDEGRFRDDPSVVADPLAWAEANPGLGVRISEEHVSRERRTMGAKSFAVERLSIGDWPPEPSEDVEHVVDMERWAGLVDRTAQMRDPVAFALDVAPDRGAASIAVAGYADGGPHVEVVESRRGVAWLVDRMSELAGKWRPCAVLLDPAGPAGSLIPSLASAGVDVTPVTAREYAQACGAFVDLVMAEREHPDDPAPVRLSHMADPRLTGSLEAATWRPLGDARVWDRRSTATDLTPLVTATLALFGLSVHAPDHYDVLSSIF